MKERKTVKINREREIGEKEMKEDRNKNED
jgi:hypothetical protein